MNRAIFLDRDGTLIEEKNYICSLSQSNIFPYTAEAVQLMNRMGFKVIVISNQSAIARGLCTQEQVEQIHADLAAILLEKKARIHGFYYCPFHPEGIVPRFSQAHPWRKPEPGMILQAAHDFDLSLPDSYMIGDDLCDIQVGQKAGCKTILVLSGKGKDTRILLDKEGLAPDLVSENILDAIQMIAGASGWQEPFY
jgi:D-glycero-D-manno-heptose 1,7-bisphosphate phosphatase